VRQWFGDRLYVRAAQTVRAASSLLLPAWAPLELLGFEASGGAYMRAGAVM